MIALALRHLETVFGWLLEASWQASVLAALVLLVQWVFRSRLNPRWRHALWLLVLARLILPALPESTLSLFQFAPQAPSTLTVSVTGPLFASAPEAEPTPPVSVPDHSPNPLSLYSLLALIWLTGVLILLAATWEVNRRFARQIRRSPDITDPEVLRSFVLAREELNMRRSIRLVESRQVQSPAIMGLFHPTLLLPADARNKFNAEELRFIFLHELAHLKRGDVIAQGLIALLQIVHWFNPVLWYAFRRMRVDREPATDALVLSRAGESEKERYGLMLIKLLEHFDQRHSLPTLVGILEDKDQFKRRFSLIARFTRGAYGWSLLGLLAIGILAVACLTKSKATDSATAISTPLSETAKVASPLSNSLAEAPSVNKQALDQLKRDILTAQEEADAEHVLMKQVENLPDDAFLSTMKVMHNEDSGTTALQGDIFAKETEIESLLKQGFEETHPKIQATRAELASKQRQLKELVAGMRQAIAINAKMADSRAALLQKKADELTSKQNSTAASSTPQDRYLTIIGKIREAERFEKQGTYSSSLQHFKACYDQLTQIHQEYPDWEQAMVTARLGDLQAKILELEKKTSSSSVSPEKPSTDHTEKTNPIQDKASEQAASQVKVSISIAGKNLKDWKNFKFKGSGQVDTPTVSEIPFDAVIIKDGGTGLANSIHEFPYPTVFEKPQISRQVDVNGKKVDLAIPMAAREFITEDVGWSIQICPQIDKGTIALQATATYTAPNVQDYRGVYGEDSGPIYEDVKNPETGKIDHLMISENKAMIPSFEKSVTPIYINAQPGKEYAVKLQCGSDWVDATVKCELLRPDPS